MTSQKHFWIFDVVGGNPCEVRLRGNPAMRHDGVRSLLRCLCTDEEADGIRRALVENEAKVRVHSPRETPEQKEERANLFVLTQNEDAWPTPRCHVCVWFDHTVEGGCGAGKLAWRGLPGWGPEVIEATRQMERAASDYEACPLDSQTE